MDIRKLSPEIAVASQPGAADVKAIAKAGYRSIICNRPDGEANDQPTFSEIEAAAKKAGLAVRYMPVTRGLVSAEDAQGFRDALIEMPGPVVAYCRAGIRSAELWALAMSDRLTLAEIVDATDDAGIDMRGAARRILNGGRVPKDTSDAKYQVVIVGGGAAGVAVAASLRARRPDLEVAIIEPADTHYYQPGWTLVGGGMLDASTTAKTMGSLIPRGVHWLRASVAAFEPESNAVILEGSRIVKYERLIVCPGLKLDWGKVEGLEETLGRNGVCSNYRYDLAAYTWEMVKRVRGGKAVFTQPPMPIKCPGAPQKAMYMSADYWRLEGVLNQVDIQFMTASDTLFGVKDYVPALEEYIRRYYVSVNWRHRLVAVDGPAKKAWFEVAGEDGETARVETDFDMLHVAPPQSAPDFIRISPLADKAGWVDVHPATLRHQTYDNIWSLGDAASTPNAKTAAAARAQAPVVAENLIDDIEGRSPTAIYAGYGSCPLTVERGKVVLAEFGYGGVLMPTLPTWMIDGTKATRRAWFLKERALPTVYWRAMLRGREWLAKPEKVTAP